MRRSAIVAASEALFFRDRNSPVTSTLSLLCFFSAEPVEHAKSHPKLAVTQQSAALGWSGHGEGAALDSLADLERGATAQKSLGRRLGQWHRAHLLFKLAA